MWVCVARAVYLGGVTLPATASTCLPLTACAILTPHTLVSCVLPAGVGPLTLLSLTVLDQTAELANPGLSYAPPTVLAASPSPLVLNTQMGSGSGVTLFGNGFGTFTQWLSAWLVANVTGLCGVGPVATVPSTFILGAGDGTVTLQFGALPFLFPSASLTMTVAGAALVTPVPILIAPPVITSLTLIGTNGSLYEVGVVGANFGAVAVSPPASGASCVAPGAYVLIDTTPCVLLTAAVVRAVRAMCVRVAGVGVCACGIDADGDVCVCDVGCVW